MSLLEERMVSFQPSHQRRLEIEAEAFNETTKERVLQRQIEAGKRLAIQAVVLGVAWGFLLGVLVSG